MGGPRRANPLLLDPLARPYIQSEALQDIAFHLPGGQMSEVLPSQKSDLFLDLDPGGSGRNAGSAGDSANCEPVHGANRGLGRVCVPIA